MYVFHAANESTNSACFFHGHVPLHGPNAQTILLTVPHDCHGRCGRAEDVTDDIIIFTHIKDL